jgi:hypothetical protein
MNWKRFGSIVLLAGVSATTPATATNLVTNGSFESGLSGWTIGGMTFDGFLPVAINYNSTAGYPVGAFNEPVPPNNAPTNSSDPVGTHAAYFVSDLTINQSISQSVFLNPGIYQIGFSVYLPQNGFGNPGDAIFSGEVAGVTLASFAASTGTPLVWQTFAGVTTITTAGTYLVEFVFDTNFFPSKDVVIDQVYIIAGNPPLPEPATISLICLGLAGLAASRRRKQ